MLHIKSPQDLGASIVLILVGAAGVYFGRDLAFGDAARMGPGYFPYYLSLCIIGIGAIVGFRAFTIAGPPIEPSRLRPILLILTSLLIFGFAMERFGLIVSAFALIAVSAFAQDRPNVRDTLLLGAGMTVFCIVVFVWALGQPLTIFGN